MPRKLPYETVLLVEKLYAANLPFAEIARRANVSSATAYIYTKARQRGFTPSGYYRHLAMQKGFATWNEYQGHSATQRQQRPINQKLSTFLKQRLAELGRTQSWLAQQLGITKAAVSSYTMGRSMPRRSLYEKFFTALELPYHTLDGLLEDIKHKKILKNQKL